MAQGNAGPLHSRRLTAAKATAPFPDDAHLLSRWLSNHDLCRASL